MRNRDFQTVSILAALTLLGYSACAAGSGNHDPYPGPSAGGTGSTGSGGEAPAGAGGEEAPDPNPGIDLGGSSNSMGGGDGVETCAATVSKAELLPLDLYFMIDTSGSMTHEASAGISKWEAVKGALEDFFRDEEAADLGVGVQYFPQFLPEIPATCATNAECLDAGPCISTPWCYYTRTACLSDNDCLIGDVCITAATCANDSTWACSQPGTDCGEDDQANPLGACTLVVAPGECANAASCVSQDYATPAIEIEPLSTNAPGLLESLAAVEPRGQTPTSSAIRGAIRQARKYAEAHPDHTVVAVLATDGAPTVCDPWDIEGVATLTAQGLDGDPSIRTFVLGIIGANDTGLFSALNTIAMAGGQPAFLIDTSDDIAEQFRDAVDNIRASSLTCDLRIPEAEDGETLDYGFVNVASSNGHDSVQLTYVGSRGDCDDEGGWYYDVNPSAGVPSRIILCPASCEGLQGSAENSVSMEVGCATVVK